MVRVQMSEDIREIESKVSKSITVKQLVWIIAAISVFLIGMIFIPISNIIIKVCIIIPFVVMCILPGYITIYKQPFIIFVTRFIVYSFIIPPKRKIVRKNSYKEDYKRMKQQRESARLKKMTSKEKKRYLKNKSKVTYSNKEKYKCYR